MKEVKYLKCVKESEYSQSFELGKVYDVIRETGADYVIVDEEGFDHYLSKEPDSEGESYKTWFVATDVKHTANNAENEVLKDALRHVLNELLEKRNVLINDSMYVNTKSGFKNYLIFEEEIDELAYNFKTYLEKKGLSLR